MSEKAKKAIKKPPFFPLCADQKPTERAKQVFAKMALMTAPIPFSAVSLTEPPQHIEPSPRATRVELIHMDDPYNRKLVPGCQGTVRWVDDMGTIHVNWDCGSSLGLIPGEDAFKKITDQPT